MQHVLASRPAAALTRDGPTTESHRPPRGAARPAAEEHTGVPTEGVRPEGDCIHHQPPALESQQGPRHEARLQGQATRLAAHNTTTTPGPAAPAAPASAPRG
jgi:hypothetical protein